MKSRVGKEDLQARLDKQHDVSPADLQDISPPQELINVENEDGISMDNNESQHTSTATTLTPDDMQNWPTPMGFQLPLIHLGPWECIENSYPTSLFPPLEPPHEPTHCAMEPELHINPIMHNDL